MEREQTTLGTGFAEAFASKDADRIRELVHPDIDFRGLTPNRNWEAADADAVVEILFDNWLEDSDEVESLDSVETDSFADRERVGYRWTVRNADGRHVVEQQAYIEERDGKIGWMRVVCSGFRPVE
jgi:SnoaL-like domain